MTLNQFKPATDTQQMGPMKMLESFYSNMMPVWAITHHSFEKSKYLHEELIELMHETNERVTDRIVNAIDHTKPNELAAALLIAYQGLVQANITIYNVAVEQSQQFAESLHEMLDKNHGEIYAASNKV